MSCGSLLVPESMAGYGSGRSHERPILAVYPTASLQNTSVHFGPRMPKKPQKNAERLSAIGKKLQFLK
jgi:hypothetical protein